MIPQVVINEEVVEFEWCHHPDHHNECVITVGVLRNYIEWLTNQVLQHGDVTQHTTGCVID